MKTAQCTHESVDAHIFAIKGNRVCLNCSKDLDMKTLEEQATMNGQRRLVNEGTIRKFLGSDNENYPELVMELLLDMANGVYSTSDLRADIKASDV